MFFNEVGELYIMVTNPVIYNTNLYHLMILDVLEDGINIKMISNYFSVEAKPIPYSYTRIFRYDVLSVTYLVYNWIQTNQ